MAVWGVGGWGRCRDHPGAPSCPLRLRRARSRLRPNIVLCRMPHRALPPQGRRRSLWRSASLRCLSCLRPRRRPRRQGRRLQHPSLRSVHRAARPRRPLPSLLSPHSPTTSSGRGLATTACRLGRRPVLSLPSAAARWPPQPSHARPRRRSSARKHPRRKQSNGPRCFHSTRMQRADTTQHNKETNVQIS